MGREGDVDHAVLRGGLRQRRDEPSVPGEGCDAGGYRVLEDGPIVLGLGAHGDNQLVSLIVMVQGLDCLLEAYGKEQADGDRADVDEEVGPGMSGFMRGVDVYH